MSDAHSAAPPARTIRFFCDHGATPLWVPGDAVDPETLELTADLAARIRAHAAFFAANAPIMPDDEWPTGERTDRWDAEELALPEAIAQQIGPGAWVQRLDGTTFHSSRASNAAAAAAFERLVAAADAEHVRAAELRAAGGVWTVVSGSGEVFSEP